MAHLILRHKKYKDHVEKWTIKNGIIHVDSNCPSNHPSKSKHTLTKTEALREYALLTSKNEGWVVEKDSKDWHKFIEEK